MPYIVKTHWSGLQGGPGITQMAIESDPPGGFIDAVQAQTVVNAVKQFWTASSLAIPNDVSLTVDPAIDFYVTATGELGTTVVAGSPPTAVTGASAGNYSAASGSKVRLLTSGIKNNRRVRGAIFLVPLTTDAYDGNGSITSTHRSQVVAAGVALSTSLAAENLDLGVWSRPKDGIPGTGGTWYPITGMQVNTKVAVLKGRRD